MTSTFVHFHSPQRGLRAIVFLVLASLISTLASPAQDAATEQTKLVPEEIFERLRDEYRTRREAVVEEPKAAYLARLEALEQHAVSKSDSYAAAAVRQEREAPDLGFTPLKIPAGHTSAETAELQRLRSEFEKSRDSALVALNSVFASELRRLEQRFLATGQPVAAATAKAECAALGQPLLKIIKAQYGRKGRYVEATKLLRKAIVFNRIELPCDNRLGGNPLPHVNKQAAIDFQVGTNGVKRIYFEQGTVIKLPRPGDLGKVGVQAPVTPGEPGIAAGIVVPPPGTQAKIASGQSAIKVPANALKANPVTVGLVTIGQTVTITPKKIWWSGGGSKEGQFCDWRGYAPENAKGIPWMALVAAVGTNEFWAKDNTLSFIVPANGNLVLYVRDDKPGNEGEGDVIVTIAPRKPTLPPKPQRTITLAKNWDGVFQGGDATRKDLAILFNKHGTPSRNTHGDPSILVFEKLQFLTPIEEARSLLKLEGTLPSKNRIGCPGLPGDSLFYYVFDGLFEGHYNRLHLVVDSADQVVSVHLVDETPRARTVRIEQTGFHTFNFINYRSRAMRSLRVEHKVSPGSRGVLIVDSLLVSPLNNATGNTSSTTTTQRRNTASSNASLNSGGRLLERSRWYVPEPIINLILRCVEGR